MPILLINSHLTPDGKYPDVLKPMVLGREVYRMTAYCQDSKSGNPGCSGFLGGGTPVFAPIVVQRTGADHEHAGRGQPYLPVREQTRRDCEVARHLQVRGDAPASENAGH